MKKCKSELKEGLIGHRYYMLELGEKKLKAGTT